MIVEVEGVEDSSFAFFLFFSLNENLLDPSKEFHCTIWRMFAPDLVQMFNFGPFSV